jgi:hypothetical protein
MEFFSNPGNIIAAAIVLAAAVFAAVRLVLRAKKGGKGGCGCGCSEK